MKVEVKVNRNALMELEYKAFELLQDLGSAIKEEAKINCPVDTGKLQTSIDIQSSTPEEIVIGSVSTTYGLFVELGTNKTRAQPYMRPSLDFVINKYNSGV